MPAITTKEYNNLLVRDVTPTSANDDNNPIDLGDFGIGPDQFGALILVNVPQSNTGGFIKVGDDRNNVVTIGPFEKRDTFNVFYPKYIYFSPDDGSNNNTNPGNVLVAYNPKPGRS